MRKYFLAALISICLSGCAGRPAIQSTQNFTVVSGATELPGPTRADLTAADRPSLIGPLDTIGVDVFNVPELSRQLQVDASGRISMPLIGEDTFVAPK
jgi:polysaccharide export outer membrane protein